MDYEPEEPDDEPTPEPRAADGDAWRGDPEPEGLEGAVAIVAKMFEDARRAPMQSEREAIMQKVSEGLDVIANALRECLEAFDWLAVERLLQEPRSWTHRVRRAAHGSPTALPERPRS
jgi:hypothetical protein